MILINQKFQLNCEKVFKKAANKSIIFFCCCIWSRAMNQSIIDFLWRDIRAAQKVLFFFQLSLIYFDWVQVWHTQQQSQVFYLLLKIWRHENKIMSINQSNYEYCMWMRGVAINVNTLNFAATRNFPMKKNSQLWTNKFQ